MTPYQPRTLPDPGQAFPIKLSIRDFNLSFGQNPILKSIHLDVVANNVTALIGPSGCGKSTLLRSLNRLNDLSTECRVSGQIHLDNQDIYAASMNIADLRRRIGMVFQLPNPFPKSVYENVAYGLRIQGIRSRRRLDTAIEHALTRAALWDEVKDRLNTNAYELSGGQQQRLVIARALAVEPEVLLLDEPASALDPISTLKIEELITELKHNYTIIIVTHNMQQAARVSDYTAYLHQGTLIEYGETQQLFTNPRKRATENYITGRFVE